MKVTLLAYTQMTPVPAVDAPLSLGAGTPQENLIEYAGRVCYRSDALMGKSPTFIAARVREGHEDIIEHVRFVFQVERAQLDRALLMLASQPTVQYTDLGDDVWIFSMNARNIRDFWVKTNSQLAQELMRSAAAVVPAVFVDANTSFQEATSV